MTNKKLDFSVERFDLVDENPNSQFATAKIQAFSSSINKHDMNCSEEVLQKTAPSIFFKPILYNINKIFDSFNSHTDPEHTLIGGFCVPNSEEFVRLPDGRLAFNIIARLFKRYVPKVMEILKRDNGAKVSVEMDLLDSEERPDGIIEMKNFEYSGICLLGEFVQPASEGAHLEMLSFAKEQDIYNEAYEKEFSNDYSELDFTIPENVKHNVNNGLELYRKHGSNLSAVVLATGRHLSKNTKASKEKILHIAKSAKSGKFNSLPKEDGNPTLLTYMLYGGDEGIRWCLDMADKIEEISKRQVSYFGETVTFPYAKISDANSAIRGIDPPVSLEQANKIASDADSIGTDEKKNGWAISISNFKKTHEVKNGKWVKKSEKEEMSVDEIDEKEMAVKPAEETKDEEKTETPKQEDKEEKKEQKENPQEEKGEDKKSEDKEEKKEEKMSLDANLDVKAMLAMLADETESYGKVAEEFAKEPEQMNYGLVMGVMYQKMCKMAQMCDGMAKMAEENKAYMAENEELKKFKADVESKQFKYEVDTCMSEIKNSTEMPQEDFDALVEKSKEFSLETIDAWKNLAKAKAFSFAVKGKKSKDEPVRYGFPWGQNSGKEQKKSIWS